MSGLFFCFRLIWGFCSKKHCILDPYYTLEVSRKELQFTLVFNFTFIYLFYLYFYFFVDLSMWLVCIQTHLNITGLVSSETKNSKGLVLDSDFSLPRYYLNRCKFAAPVLTGTPPRWFISSVGLLAAAGDQTEEPGLSHRGKWVKEERVAYYCHSAASLCSQEVLCPHLSFPHTQMNPIFPFNINHYHQCIKLKRYIHIVYSYTALETGWKT